MNDVAGTLATFLVIWVACMAIIGFVAFVLRGTLRPSISNRMLLRLTSYSSLFVAFALWFLVLPRVG